MATFPRIRPLVWHILLTIFVLFTIAYFVSNQLQLCIISTAVICSPQLIHCVPQVMGVVLVMSARMPKQDHFELNSHYTVPVGFLFFLGFLIFFTFLLNIQALRAPIFIKIVGDSLSLQFETNNFVSLS